MALDPLSDGSGWAAVPQLTQGMAFRDYGSYGLRQFGGWVREEYLQDLVGRQGARAYREMIDGSAVIGSMLFAIQQTMRKVEWRVNPPSDSAAAMAEAEFVEGLIEDMSHTWEDFVAEALSMLGYGYSPHEIVYKRRLGRKPDSRPGPRPAQERASSRFDDGRIGWRRLPIRGQDTVIKWFFDPNGQLQGLTQQPWVGQLIDIPIKKLLLFRPTAHKNNPEGRSVLRNAYRSWYFTKRLEEQEAILIERMNGFPVMYVPSSLIDRASATGPETTQAINALAAYKKITTNIRVDEQMGAVLPSDVFVGPDGKPTPTRMYELQFVTPQHPATGKADTDKVIARHKTDMMITLLCDFIQLGHEVRGTNNLAVTKVDMFYAAIEGWLNSIASVVNRFGLERIWQMNALDPELMPEIVPDLSQRLDLDSLGNYVANLTAAGIPLGDDETQMFFREAGGMPADEGTISDAQDAARQAAQDTLNAAIATAQAKKPPDVSTGPKKAKPAAKPKASGKQKVDSNAA